MTVPVEEGGDAHGIPRPGVGESVLARPKIIVGNEDGISSQEEFDYTQDTVEEAYADHIHNKRNGGYPPEPPAAPTQAQLDEQLAGNRVDPGTAKKDLFIKIGEYEDAAGNALPSSPVERLRQELKLLRGEVGGPGLSERLTLDELSETDLGRWTAAKDLKATTDTAQSTLGQAITRIYTVYEAVVQALDETVQTAKNADQSIASGMKKK